jgi:predicted NUDIX family phosphoesterase
MKYALTVPRTQTLSTPMDNWGYDLLPRSGPGNCEEDQTQLQLMSYIVLIDESGFVFSYSRGGDSDEKRLVAKRSIGVGGHVDTLPPGNLRSHLIDEVIREIQEEVGFSPTVAEVKEALTYCTLLFPEIDAPAVDQVHLGIYIVINVLRSDLTKLEDGVIVDPKWLEIPECGDVEQFCIDNNLESWSIRCMTDLACGGN